MFPARLEGDGWRDAVAGARERVAWVRDDLEFFVLCTLMVEELGSALTGAVRQAALPDPDEIEITVRVADGIAWMRTGHLLEALDEIDAAFADVRGARALILDLRGARGLDPTCGRLLAWLCPDQRPVGTMLGRRLADRGPLDDAERDGLPLVSGVYDKHLMRLMLGARGGAAGASEVLEPFRGEVVVLVDERTATALEPVVEFLQREGLATIVGRPTAGEMLDAELYDLPAGWTAVVPLGAYFTWDGRSLDGTGVEPDVLVDRSGALLAALELLGASPGTFSPISP